MNIALRSILFLVLVLCLPFTSHAAIDYEYLDARIEVLMRRDDMMGLSIAVVEDGEIRFVKGYGYTAENGQRVDENTRFRWASVSKGLAGSLAAQLEQEGRLSLDAHIVDFGTSLRLPGFGENYATVRDLLSHKLGIQTRAFNSLLERGSEPKDIRASLASLKPACPVSDCHKYQNVAFDTISEIFERVTGEDFEHLAQHKVFGPLGMTSATTTYEGLTSTSNYARPHSWSIGQKRLYPDGVTLPYFKIASAAGVSSSITDMGRFLQAQIGAHPAVFHPEALRRAQEPQVRTLGTELKVQSSFEHISKAEYGLGWRIYDYNGHKLVGHEGMVRGSRAFILFDPQERSGLAVMWNSNVTRPAGLQFEVMDMVYGLPKRDWMRLLD